MNTSDSIASSSSGPTPRLGDVTPYAPKTPSQPIDLFLDANEGPGLGLDLGAIGAKIGPESTRRYSRPADLERAIAERLGVSPARVVVTCGGDEAIDRTCRAFLGPGSELICPVPTFEMIGRYATLAGGDIVTTVWDSGAYPTEAVLDLVTRRTRMIAVVSPNNPTGAVASADDLVRLSEGASDAVILVDLAYTEFADQDLTETALALPNTVVIRTFSKAYGLAGLRVGYAVGSERVARALRASGPPYPVSALSMAAAMEALQSEQANVRRAVARVRLERNRLEALLVDLGASPQSSQANFVLSEFPDADWAWDALAGLGIGVRRFGAESELHRSLRITCPGDHDSFDRLCRGLRSALRPDALLFDMDGVIADVSMSYRRAIEITAASFGVQVSQSDIARAKAQGDANNDWVLTHRLVTMTGRSASLDEVTSRFESMYQGSADAPGLWTVESLIPDPALFERLSRRTRLGIVTGRPRRDAERFLRHFGLDSRFDVMVCMEDGAPKPDAAPIRYALRRLGVATAWMIGDTPDDIVSARAAGVVPIGIVAPGHGAESQRCGLKRAGAARVIAQLSDLERLLS